MDLTKQAPAYHLGNSHRSNDLGIPERPVCLFKIKLASLAKHRKFAFIETIQERTDCNTCIGGKLQKRIEMTKFVKHGFFVSTLVLGFSTFALAHPGNGNGHNPDHDPGHYPGDPKPQQAPEIDPSLAVGAVSLIGGSLLVQRSRRSR